MICTLTARRLKPSAYDAFRSEWNPAGVPEGWTRIYHARDVLDRNVVISFGLFHGTLEELREAQSHLGRPSQVDRIAPTWSTCSSTVRSRSLRS